MSQTPTPSGQAQDERAAFEAWWRTKPITWSSRMDCIDFELHAKSAAFIAWNRRASMAGPAPLADEQIRRAFEADSYESLADFMGGVRFAERHHTSAAAESRAALQTLLDIWHGGHLSVRPEAAGYWGAAVEAGEKLLDRAALERK